ncbi:MAG: RnfABCDGE type electron transport complex subunit D [Flavobacteriales bacterium]|nr:RnfABCDGE type electron transport complex subunit D [Flavobacteriales bacterium]
MKLTLSPSPHIHSGNSMSNVMWTVVIAMIPALLVSVYFFGLGALLVTAVAVSASVFFEWAITKYLLQQESTLQDGSAIITGLLLAFNLPSNLPLHIIIIGALVAIGIGKMSFGGLGQNPFNPALVGRVFLLISFPVQMTSWPLPNVLNFSLDATTGATALGVMSEGLRNGESATDIMNQLPSMLDMATGAMGGSLGEVSAIALILGGLYMLYKKVITWHIPVSMLVSAAALSGILHLVNPDLYACPPFHLLTGGMMLGAIFMATDMVTSPMTPKGQIFFGVGVGLLSIVIRTWGAYPEGVSFAILLMNGWTPLINRYMKPQRFGK